MHTLTHTHTSVCVIDEQLTQKLFNRITLWSFYDSAPIIIDYVRAYVRVNKSIGNPVQPQCLA